MNNNNIEEDIKICKTFKTRQKTINYNKITLEDVQSIESILADRERLEKENKELKDIDLSTVYLKGIFDGKEKATIDNSICKEKLAEEALKENIKLKRKYDSLVEKIKKKIEAYSKNCTVINSFIVEALQELLKGE